MNLTTQQNAVLQHRLRALTTKSIAEQMGISTGTVVDHLKKLHVKFGVKNVVGLVNEARKQTVVIDDSRSRNSEGM